MTIEKYVTFQVLLVIIYSHVVNRHSPVSCVLDLRKWVFLLTALFSIHLLHECDKQLPESKGESRNNTRREQCLQRLLESSWKINVFLLVQQIPEDSSHSHTFPSDPRSVSFFGENGKNGFTRYHVLNYPSLGWSFKKVFHCGRQVLCEGAGFAGQSSRADFFWLWSVSSMTLVFACHR